MNRISYLITFSLAVASLHAADPGGTAPATLTKEGDLMVLTLKPEAEQRLRLKVVPVAMRSVPAARMFAGEVVLPLGSENNTVAPVIGGTLDEVLRLADLQAAADGRILQAQVQIDAALTIAERAQKMLSADAGSAKAVDDAKATLALAEAAKTTAKAQRDLLGGTVGSGTRKWARVAIYSGEAPLLDAKADASIHALGSSTTILAKTISGPLTANALANTVDWYYALPTETKLRAGERVAVEIPLLDSKTESLVVPFIAVLHDFHGGQWVYEQTAEHAYSRRRVQVARLSGGDAVLASGPKVGSKIVTDGAAELFGTEFVTGK